MARQNNYQNFFKPNLKTESRTFLWRRCFVVRPNKIGLLYRKNRFEKTLEPGIYYYWDFRSELELFAIPRSSQSLVVTGQEVLTKDNIALRFSYIVDYKVTDGQKLLTHVDLNQSAYLQEFVDITGALIRSLTQIYWRDVINQINSLDLNEQRESFTSDIPDLLQASVKKFGIELEFMQLRDITFPKRIQELFALQLEAKIRGQTDLENARTAVATARALKNASQLMGDEQNIRFLQYMEALVKIASSGKHTFVIGSSETMPSERQN